MHGTLGNESTQTGLVPRATIEEIVGKRNKALELYGVAHVALCAAGAACGAAVTAGRVSGRVNAYNHHQDVEHRNLLDLAGGVMKLPERDKFMADARRLVDTDVWSHVVELTELERLMDKTAKDQFRKQLTEDPPEVTVENVAATLQQFMLDGDTIFKRGIATCFSALDRRFRSHDGWRIGSRVILSNAFDEWGSWSYHRNHRDTLQDIERTFMMLDGKRSPASYAGIVGAVEASRSGRGLGRRQSEVANDYFTVRGFKNGNAHVWFKRDDLLVEVNKLIGSYYGEAIPEEREPEDDGGLFSPKTALAKNYGFFPTPQKLADDLLGDLPLHRGDGPPLMILEPSAGDGALARCCAKMGHVVDCVEVEPRRAAALKAERLYRRVSTQDFLALAPSPIYDAVLMNPPFDRERDVDHVVHALRFLKPDGWLFAIMSAGTEWRQTRKSKAFRALLKERGARYRDLPAGSFCASGTNVNTIAVRVGAAFTRWWGEACFPEE